MRHKTLNREINKYIISVKSYLICDWRTRQKFLKDLKNDINDFVDEKEDVTMDDIRDRFGEPEKISRSFLESADLKKIKRRMNFGRTLAVTAAIALMIWAVGVTVAVIDSSGGYIVTEFDGETISEETV